VAALGFGYGLGGSLWALVVLALAGAVFTASLVGMKKGMSKPALLTHVGVALLIIGIVISSAAAQTTMVELTEGEEQEVLGIPITYVGWEDLPDTPGYTDKYIVAGAEMSGVTRFDKSGQRSVHEPAIKRGLFYDLYLAPTGSSGHNNYYTLTKDEPILVEGSLTLTFRQLGMSGEDNHAHNIYALLDAELDGATELVEALMQPKEGGFEAVETFVFEQYAIGLIAVSNDQEAIMLTAHDLDCTDHSGEQMMAEVSRKPLINLVWLGTIIISIGTIWAAVRRKKESK
jgi:cytochrome c-type biogenesis protein CcmF